MIKPAILDDLSRLSPLFDQYRQFYGQASNLNAAAKFIRERLTSGESTIFVDEASGRFRGFLQLYPSFSSISMKRSWILNDLFVSEENRRQGVAEALITAAVDFSRRSGAKGLMLQTARTNEEAQQLYTKLGWKRDDEFLVFNFTHT